MKNALVRCVNACSCIGVVNRVSTGLNLLSYGKKSSGQSFELRAWDSVFNPIKVAVKGRKDFLGSGGEGEGHG